jgi:hypothetical protein
LGACASSSVTCESAHDPVSLKTQKHENNLIVQDRFGLYNKQ